MNDKALIRRDSATLTLELTPVAIAMKSQALENSAPIAQVIDAASNQVAIEAQQTLAALRRMADKAYDEAVAPYNKARAAIKKAIDDYKAEILLEEGRIADLTGSYFQLQEQKRKAAENAARLEAERVEREKQQEILRIAREAAAKQAKIDAEAAEARRLIESAAAAARAKEDEAKAAAQAKLDAAKNEAQRKESLRLQAELAKKAEAAEAKRVAEATQMQAEIDRQRELAQAQSHEQLDKINADYSQRAAEAPPMPLETPKLASGQSIKKDWDVTVSDIWLLAKAHPTCVKIEPRISEIKILLDAGVKVAGVTATSVVKSQTLGRYSAKPIDV